LGDHGCGSRAYLFAFCCEDLSDGVVGYEFTPGAGYDRRNDFPFDGLRQIRLDVIEVLGIKTIPDCDCET